MAMMADCVGFQAQIASIIEMLANSAVVEICKLVDDGYAALRSQMDREREKSEKENDALRRKLRDMDVKMRTYERKMRRRIQRADDLHNVQFRPPEEPENHITCDVPMVTGHMAMEDTPHDLSQEEGVVEPLVKEEAAEKSDCNLDLKVELNIRSERGLSTVLPTAEDPGSSEPPAACSAGLGGPAGDTMDLTCRARRKAPRGPASAAAGDGEVDLDGGGASDVALKPEVAAGLEAESDQLAVAAAPPSPERLSLGLDLAWMQERVSHLGAAFAVAQLGLGNPEGGHPAASFAGQGGGADCLDGPPTMVFPGAAAAAHDMAAFAASFDLAAAGAAAAGPPAAAAAPPSAIGSLGGVAKEPMVCGVCGRVFPSAPALELHRRAHAGEHAGERPFSCPHCGKGFAQPNNLRVHLLIHSGERRYGCSLCGKSFISSSHLKRHRTVHTQEKPYSCARCGQSFSQMCSVRRHRQQSQCGL